MNVTLYIPATADRQTVSRARKLLVFHEDKSLSQFFVDKAKEVVQQYDGKPRSGKRPA